MIDNIKKEAIKRLEKLRLKDEVKNMFTNEDKIYLSERQNKLFPATLFYLDERYKKMVEDFEKENGHKVYHCILTRTTFGTILDMLFVSKYEDDWEYEFEEYEDGSFRLMSMANNLDDESMSDMGSIIVRPVMGGLERIG